TYRYNRADSNAEASFVTDVFELTGRTSTVEVKTYAPVSNHWIYLNYALINQDTGQAWDFGREVRYYYGYDSDGSWTEGKQNDDVVIPSVPPGHYYLRIEPEADPSLSGIPYTVDVTYDVPVYGIYGIAFLAARTVRLTAAITITREANEMNLVRLGNVVAALVFAFVGIFIFVVAFVVMDKLTPYHLWKEIVQEHNMALAILVGAMSLGICIIIAAAIH